MPLSFDEWLNETYAGEPEVLDDGGPSPFTAGAAVESTEGVAPAAFDEDIGNFMSNITESGFGNTSPNESPVPAMQPAQTPQLQSAGGSVSTSGSGFNFSPEKTQQVKAGFTNQVDARNAQSQQDIYGEANQIAGEYRGVADAQKANVAARTNLDIEKAAIESEAAFEEADLIADLNFKEKLGYEEARMKEEQAMANWAGAMKAYEASNINPGKLWGDMNGSDRFNTAAAVFAHNILASKGINTTTMASLNRALDDNLNAQLQNMEKKGRVAGQFKQVYDAVRSESESEAEARMKMRGLMLQEFRAGVTAKLSSMDSDYAKIKAQEIYTGIEQQLVKDMTELRQIYRQNNERERAYNSDLMYKEAQLRMEAYRNSLSARQVALQEKEAEAKKAPPQWDPELLVRDPAGIDMQGQATPIGHARTKEQAAELEKKLNYQYDAAKAASRISELSRERGKIYTGPGRAQFMTKHKAEMESIRLDLVTAKKRALSGLAATDNEQKVFEQIIGTMDGWSKGVFGGDSQTLVHTMSKTLLRDLRKARYDLGTGLSYPGDLSGKGVRINEVPGVFMTEEDLQTNIDPKPEQTKTKERIGEIEGPGAWEDREATPEQVYRYSKTAGKQIETEFMGKKVKGTSLDTTGGKIPQWAVAMDDVYETVKNRSVGETERAQAANALSEMVDAYGKAPDKQKKGLKMGDWEAKGRYARDLYQELLNDNYIDIHGNVLTDSIEGAEKPVERERY
jgi:hypothetical protein